MVSIYKKDFSKGSPPNSNKSPSRLRPNPFAVP